MASLLGSVKVLLSFLATLLAPCHSALGYNHSDRALPDTCAVRSYPEKREVDVACNGQLPDFSQIDFPQASYLYEMVMKDCTFDRMPKNALQGLTGLHHLYMYCDKRVPELQFEEGALLDLRQLNVIVMSGNNIRTLPPNIFCGLPNLEKLFIADNSISSPEILGFESPSCSPSDCPNRITILKLSENTIRHLPRHAFCTMAELVYLDVSNTTLMSMDEDALLGLGALRVLDVSHNNLTTIPENALRYLTGLFNLDLASNPHFDMGDGGFLKHLPHMKGLFLPDTGLERLEKDVFRGLDKLESLMLYDNRLQAIDEDVFEPLIGVPDGDVDPDECEEDAVVRLVFGGEIFNLNAKQAKVLNLTGVRYLNLDKNNFTSMPPIRKLFKMQVFSIAKNQIDRLDDDDFRDLRRLQRLTLSYNRIESIGSGTFANLKCLRQLFLDYNSIRHIDETSFYGLESLTTLSMRYNRIKSIHGLFARNEYLENLNLSHNSIEEISLEALPSNITKLDLSHNLIKILQYFPNSLPKQNHMDVLDLSNNQISTVNRTFFPHLLTQLYLHNNLIRNISECIFCTLGFIENVTLHNNLLRTVSPSELRINTLPAFQKTPTVSLNDNDLRCDCRLHELSNFRPKQGYLKIHNLESLMCHREYSRGKSSLTSVMFAVPPEDFLCRSTHRGHAACAIFHDFDWNYVIADCSGANLTAIPSAVAPQVRKLYLDGNDFSRVSSTSFNDSRYHNLSELFLNGSNVEVIEDDSFYGLVKLSRLHLENNRLKYLSGKTFAGLGQLLQLHLSANLLAGVDDHTFSPLLVLRTLQLNDNLMRSFPIWRLEELEFLSTISLRNNPWSCDCDFVRRYREWMRDHASAVVDIASLSCKFDGDSATSGVPLIAYNASNCYRSTQRNFLESRNFSLLVGLLTSLVIFAVAAMVLCLYRREMQVLISNRLGVRNYHKNRDKVGCIYRLHSVPNQPKVTEIT